MANVKYGTINYFSLAEVSEKEDLNEDKSKALRSGVMVQDVSPFAIRALTHHVDEQLMNGAFLRREN